MRIKNQASIIAIVLALLTAAVLAAVFAWPSQPQSQPTGSASLTVSVSGIANNKGQILVAVCDKATFLKHCTHGAMAQPAPTVELRFPQLTPGDYAVMVLHDENGNHVMDKTANGIPLEGYGFSRNARGKYGPPSFEDAMVALKPGPTRISIELVY
ncbi:DUF2141 domain-containing protein [Paraherbaspirillum soli]|uniref:DUF2141 domain-containing protein n=1 Tax=Paraherbaspirillum soli TaxID=631222 RepID=A0ABW0MDM6_9BURK